MWVDQHMRPNLAPDSDRCRAYWRLVSRAAELATGPAWDVLDNAIWDASEELGYDSPPVELAVGCSRSFFDAVDDEDRRHLARIEDRMKTGDATDMEMASRSGILDAAAERALYLDVEKALGPVPNTAELVFEPALSPNPERIHGDDFARDHAGQTAVVAYNLHNCPRGRMVHEMRGYPWCWTVRRGVSGRVLAHTNRVLLQDVEFVVQPGGLRRIRQKGRREVIAYARGTLVPFRGSGAPKRGWKDVTFNPFRDDTFVVKSTGEPVRRAAWAAFVGVYASVIGAEP